MQNFRIPFRYIIQEGPEKIGRFTFDSHDIFVLSIGKGVPEIVNNLCRNETEFFQLF